jgi:hypothetical protein
MQSEDTVENLVPPYTRPLNPPNLGDFERQDTSQSTSENLITSEYFAQQKIKARKQLLSLDPAIAQQHANQTLYPQYWQHNDQELTWDESIPTHYGETDP